MSRAEFLKPFHERIRQVVAWRQAGLTWVWIASQLKVSSERVRQLGRKGGVASRPYRKRTAEKKAFWRMSA